MPYFFWKYKTAAYEDNWLPSRVLHLLLAIDTKFVAPHKTGLLWFIKGSLKLQALALLCNLVRIPVLGPAVLFIEESISNASEPGDLVTFVSKLTCCNNSVVLSISVCLSCQNIGESKKMARSNKVKYFILEIVFLAGIVALELIWPAVTCTLNY